MKQIFYQLGFCYLLSGRRFNSGLSQVLIQGLIWCYYNPLLCVPLFLLLCVEAMKSFSCAQLCNPMDCSLPGSSIHGIF